MLEIILFAIVKQIGGHARAEALGRFTEGGGGYAEEMFSYVVVWAPLLPLSRSSSGPLSSSAPPTAAGAPQGKVYYGWVNSLINIQPLDRAFPRWPIKNSNWQSVAKAAGCRGGQGWRL
ncbi:hypothetical protein AAFF_G00045590 [Aldrovandia affinis]|uniref:Uncharacterized protein n=1 Tax=Aldrovandia affinis TaxID=143900 RepID=A0AAD7S239_9TELE|nr:hypothetical protein AAFF_G00045590 [Aldrovandia affinis]